MNKNLKLLTLARKGLDEAKALGSIKDDELKTLKDLATEINKNS